MSVECTVIAVADYSCGGTIWPEAMIRLGTHYDLWAKLHALKPSGFFPRMQVMFGGDSTTKDGQKVQNGVEGGYLSGDRYGSEGFHVYDREVLDAILAVPDSEFDLGPNRAKLELVRTMYGVKQFCLFWH